MEKRIGWSLHRDNEEMDWALAMGTEPEKKNYHDNKWMDMGTS